MYRATIQYRHSCIDQENLSQKQKNRRTKKNGDTFFFRPYTAKEEVENNGVTDINDDNQENNNESEDGYCDHDDDDIISVKEGNSKNDDTSKYLLYVHQTKWQRELLNKFGKEICLLDTPYKTCLVGCIKQKTNV